MQKKDTRIITGIKWNSHTGNLFKNCNILKLGDINSLQVGCFVYQVINGNIPGSFTKTISLLIMIFILILLGVYMIFIN